MTEVFLEQKDKLFFTALLTFVILFYEFKAHTLRCTTMFISYMECNWLKYIF